MGSRYLNRRRPGWPAQHKGVSNMKTLRILDSSGDRVIEFDETETLANTARREAEALFERLLSTGYSAFSVAPDGGPAQRVDSFDDLQQGETVLVPRIVGG
jgi:hypothetical protein